MNAAEKKDALKLWRGCLKAWIEERDAQLADVHKRFNPNIKPILRVISELEKSKTSEPKRYDIDSGTHRRRRR